MIVVSFRENEAKRRCCLGGEVLVPGEPTYWLRGHNGRLEYGRCKECYEKPYKTIPPPHELGNLEHLEVDVLGSDGGKRSATQLFVCCYSLP